MVPSSESVNHKWRLIGILVLAFFLRAWNISKEGFGNFYYYATVGSMLKSSSNFLFTSFDPLGFVSVDKPPMALWIQGISAWLFGLNTSSVMLPQAVLGVSNVFLTWKLMKDSFSERIALIASFVMAVMPISVAVDRLNMPDTFLLTTVLLSSLALLQSCKSGSFLALATSMIFLAVGFTTKMFAAWVTLPVWLLVWWKYSSTQQDKKLHQVTLACVLLALTSFAWALFVDFTPPDKRPYVGGSTTNSMLELIFGYNGLGRALGGGHNISFSFAEYQKGFKPGGRFFFVGPIGPWRLLWPTMAGLAFWLVPFALRGCLSWKLIKGQKINQSQATVTLLVGWFAMWAFVLCFSYGTIHPYYSVMIGPAIAGLSAISLDNILNNSWPKHRMGIAFFVFALIWQLVSISYSPQWRVYLVPGLFMLLGGSYYWVHFKKRKTKNRLALNISVFGFLIAPFLWALIPTFGRYPSMMPVADPSFLYKKPGDINAIFNNGHRETRRRLLIYLKKQNIVPKILLATALAPDIAPFIVETGDNFLSLGGFIGQDPIFTEQKLLEMVKNGELAYFLKLSSKPLASDTLNQFIQKYGKLVAANDWYELDPKPKPENSIPPGDFQAKLDSLPELYQLNPISR